MLSFTSLLLTANGNHGKEAENASRDVSSTSLEEVIEVNKRGEVREKVISEKSPKNGKQNSR